MRKEVTEVTEKNTDEEYPLLSISTKEVRKKEPFHQTSSGNERTCSFTYLSKDGNWIRVTLKAVNFIYALWASFVFALMSFFRVSGRDNFKNLTEEEIIVGILFALSSLMMNVPMGYFFSFKMILNGKKFFSKKVFSRDGDWAFGISFILGSLLGALTTFAGIAVGILSLQEWAPLWLAILTLLIFAYNTFTTRMVSTSLMLYETWLSFAYLLNNVLSAIGLKKNNLFTLLKDLNQFEEAVRWLEVEKTQDDLLYYQKAIKDFYDKLSDLNFSPSNPLINKSFNFIEKIACMGMGIFSLGSIALWLNLTQKGLATTAESLEKSRWFFWLSVPLGKITWLVWLSILSNLGLYFRSGFRMPQIFRMIFNRPGMQGLPWYKKTFILFAFLSPFFVAGYFSGTGYDEIAKDEREEGDRSTAEELLESNFFMASLYQLLYYFIVDTLNIWTNGYYEIISGINANGYNAILGTFSYLPDSIKKKIPTLFSDGKPATNNPMSSSELKEFIECVHRDLVPEGFDRPLDPEELQELKKTISSSRKEWLQSKETLLGGQKPSWYERFFCKKRPQKTSINDGGQYERQFDDGLGLDNKNSFSKRVCCNIL